MELFSPTRVAYELREGMISEHESMKYLMVTVAIEFFNSQSYASRASENKSLFVYCFMVLTLVLIAVWGIRACYKANGGVNGKDFIKRYVCISLPIDIIVSLGSIAVLLFLIPVFVVPLMFRGPASEAGTLPLMVYIIGFALGLGLHVFAFLWKCKVLRSIQPS